MKEFIFRPSRGRALLIGGNSLPAERARFRLENEKSGTLVLSDKSYPFCADGAILTADALPSGIYTPILFVDGKRYEAPPVSVGAGCFFFLPPTHAEICRLEDEIRALSEAHTALTQRLCKIEARMQDTIF